MRKLILLVMALLLVPATANAGPVQQLISSSECGNPIGEMGRDRVGHVQISDDGSLTWYRVNARVEPGDYTVSVVTRDCSLVGEVFARTANHNLMTSFGLPSSGQTVRVIILRHGAVIASTHLFPT